MSRDFAQKSSGRGGASPHFEVDEETPRRELPAWSWMIFGVALGFGLAKWLDEEPPVPRPAMTAVPAQPAASPDTTGSTTVNEERRRFDFYNLLPQQEVTTDPVEAYKSTPRDSESLPEYVLQVGSFRAKEDAERFMARLRKKGYEPVIASSSSANGTWHRVRIGPFRDRRKLNRAQDDMAKDNIQSLLIRLP